MKHIGSVEGVRAFLETQFRGQDADEIITRLTHFAELLIKHAGHRSLLSASQRNSEAIWTHFFDSLQPLALSSVRDTPFILDAGSGGGLPGVPLAIARSKARVCLVDRRSSKAEFLELAKAVVPLPNVEVCCDQLEAFSTNVEGDPVVVARALVRADMWPAIIKKTRLAGPWIIYATEKTRAAWKTAASECDMTLKATHEYSLTGTAPLRALLEFTPL